MAISILYFLMSLNWQAEVPYKPNDEFHLELEYKFKQKPGTDHLTYDFDETYKERNKKQYSGNTGSK